MLVIDSNGQSETISIFLTSLEPRKGIFKMVKAFKAANSLWNRTGVVISDKDFTEEFPSVSMHIFFFHVLRSFWHEITCDKLGLRSGEWDHILELITKLAYARSEEEYHEHYTSLLSTNLQSVITNLHCIRHEWVEAYKSVSFTLGEGTNNRIKSINSKIKSVCSRFGSLSPSLINFCCVSCS